MSRSQFRFSFPLRVRYAEVDQQGVVFNAHYLTYFDTAIVEYLRAIDYDYQGEPKKTGEDFHTVKSLVEYKRPIAFDEQIDVCVRVAKLGRSSITFVLAIFASGSDDLHASGEVVWVNASQTTHQSMPIHSALAAKIMALEGEQIR